MVRVGWGAASGRVTAGDGERSGVSGAGVRGADTVGAKDGARTGAVRNWAWALKAPNKAKASAAGDIY